MSDSLALGLTSFHCPLYNDWQNNSHVDSVLNNYENDTGNGTSVGTGIGTGNGNGMGSGTCKGTDMVTYNTSNIINGHGTSMVCTMPGMLTKQNILTHPRYSHLFSGIGKFWCKPMHIMVKPQSNPVQKPPRHVPIAMRDKFKQELDSMEAQGIVSKYDGHNASPEWLNSFVIMKKPNGSLRICLDPTDLNTDIVRPICNSQTIDNVVHKLKDARYFAVFDTSKGFFHVPLDAESKVLTAMLTPFGIYVYNVLAMGLSYAMDVFEMCKSVVPPQSWGDRSDTKHSKCLLLGGRRLNQLTLIPKPKGSGGARAATAQVGPANKRNDTKRCLPVEASLRPGEAVPW